MSRGEAGGMVVYFPAGRPGENFVGGVVWNGGYMSTAFEVQR